MNPQVLKKMNESTVGMVAKRPDQISARLAAMAREELVSELKKFPAECVRIDFTDDYLDRLSDDRLRHLLLAVWLHIRQTKTSSSA